MARPVEFNASDVLHKAMNVFWRKGYEATALADLLAATGLSKSSLYSSFGGKHDLFLAAFDFYRRDRKRDMDLLLGRGTARESIEAFFGMILADGADPAGGSGCMSVNQAVELAPSDPLVRKRVMEDFDDIEHALVTAINRRSADNSISMHWSSAELAGLLVLAFPGLQLIARAGMGQDRIERAFKNLMSLLD